MPSSSDHTLWWSLPQIMVYHNRTQAQGSSCSELRPPRDPSGPLRALPLSTSISQGWIWPSLCGREWPHPEARLFWVWVSSSLSHCVGGSCVALCCGEPSNCMQGAQFWACRGSHQTAASAGDGWSAVLMCPLTTILFPLRTAFIVSRRTQHGVFYCHLSIGKFLFFPDFFCDSLIVQ